jgi:hypothetical protein
VQNFELERSGTTEYGYGCAGVANAVPKFFNLKLEIPPRTIQLSSLNYSDFNTSPVSMEGNTSTVMRRHAM